MQSHGNARFSIEGRFFFDLMSFDDAQREELIGNLNKLNMEYFFLNDNKLVVYGSSSLINQVRLHMLSNRVCLPFGEKQGAFQIRCEINSDGHICRAQVGRVGGIPLVPVQIDISEHEEFMAAMHVAGSIEVGQPISEAFPMACGQHWNSE